MPILIAGLIRAAIQFAVTIGIVSLVEKYVLPLINRAIQEVIEAFGVSEQEAKDIVANSWLQALEEIGIAAATIKTKTPTKIAQLLGFSTKGFTYKIIPQSIVKKFPFLAPGAAKALATEAALVTEKVAAVAKTRGISLDGASKIAQLLIAGLGVPIGAGLLVINTIDFAAWPTSSYQDFFQKFFAIFGLEADKEKVSTKVLSQDQFDKAYEIFRLEGITEVYDPYSDKTWPFDRTSMSRLLDKIASQIMLEKGKYTINQVIAVAIAYMKKGKVAAAPSANASVATTTTTPIATLQARTKTEFKTDSNELTNLALGKVATLLDSLPAYLDFELTVRTNPLDETGKLLAGKFYTLQIKLRSGQFGSTKLREVILRPLAEKEEALTTATEAPIEEAIRNAVSGTTSSMPAASINLSIPTATDEQLRQEKVGADQKPYIQFKGSPDVFDRISGRYISNTEATSNNLFKLGLIESLDYSRPEIKIASDYALYSGKDLTNWKQETVKDGYPVGSIFYGMTQNEAIAYSEAAARSLNTWIATTAGKNYWQPIPEYIRIPSELNANFGAVNGVLYNNEATWRQVMKENGTPV